MKTNKQTATKTSTSTKTKKALAAVAPRIRAKASERFRGHDPRVLAAYPVGSTITKEYRPHGGDPVVVGVKVLNEGYEFNSRVYASLSAVGKAVRGEKPTDGMWFFGLTNPHEGKGSK